MKKAKYIAVDYQAIYLTVGKVYDVVKYYPSNGYFDAYIEIVDDRGMLCIYNLYSINKLNKNDVVFKEATAEYRDHIINGILS